MAVDLQELIDIDLLAYFKTKLDLLFSGKVDKVDGKGLSDTNFTQDEKAKLANIAAGAEVNVNADWNAATGDAAILNKPSIPSKTSDLTNDSGYITSADVPEGAAASTTTPKMNDITATPGTETAFARGDHVHPIDSSRAAVASPTFTGTPKAPTASKGTNTTQIATTAFVATAISGKADSSTTLAGYGITDAYTKSEIDTKLSAAMNYKGTKATVAALPSSGNNTGDVWHVTATNGEYAWNGTAWEELGSTIDLSGYVEESEISLATTDDIDDLFE